jgi:hypothetical protein
MLARLADVLYWGGLLIAGVLAIGAGWVLLETGDRRPGFIVFVFAPAMIVWLIGRAARYVLAGR